MSSFLLELLLALTYLYSLSWKPIGGPCKELDWLTGSNNLSLGRITARIQEIFLCRTDKTNTYFWSVVGNRNPRFYIWRADLSYMQIFVWGWSVPLTPELFKDQLCYISHAWQVWHGWWSAYDKHLKVFSKIDHFNFSLWIWKSIVK